MGDIDDVGLPESGGADAHRVRRRVPSTDDAVAELESAFDDVRAARRAVPVRRWWRERTYRRAVRRFNEANRQYRCAFDGIARAAVGSIPGQWGLLSDNIEHTLNDFTRGDISNELHERLKAINSNMFDARIFAHTGDRSLEAQLTEQLAACLDLEPDEEHVRRLLHHLPGSSRPIPDIDLDAVAAELEVRGLVPFGRPYFDFMDYPWFGCEPRFQLTTLTVTFKATDTLELHDIVVHDTLTGRRPTCSAGLGTAALEHLCRSADHYGLAIVGKIMPGDRTEPSAARLAGWYGRHGFEVVQQSPGEYLLATIRRQPQAPASS